jgi:outer membrane protein assembly factor BamB
LAAAAVLMTLIAQIPVSADSSGSTASSALWPEFHYGPARVAFNPTETTIGTANVGTLVRGWNRRMPTSLNFILASPVISGKTMYLVGHSLTAVNTATGGIRWSVASPGYTESTPAIDAGTIFVPWSNGDVVAYNATNGAVRWTTNLPSASFSTGPGTPGVKNGMVYITAISAVNQTTLNALDESTGAIRWSVNFTQYLGTPAITSSVLVVGFQGGMVKAFNPLSGAPLWSTSTAGSAQVDMGIQGNVVYIAESCDLIALNASTGAPIFSTVPAGCSGAAFYGPALAYGRVYVATNDGHLYAFDGGTGAIDWTAAITGGGDPSIANGVVYQGFSTLRAFDAASGALLFNTPVGGYSISDVDVTGGHVFIVYGNGKPSGKTYASMYKL